MSRALVVVFSVICQVLAGSSHASVIAPDLVPLEKLVRSANIQLRMRPRDAEAHATLADVHRLAFSKGKTELFAYPERGGHMVPAGEMHYEFMERDHPWREGPNLSWRRRTEHAVLGFISYREAMRLNPRDADIALRSAALIEEIVERKPQMTAVPPVVSDLDLRSAREAVTHAMELADIEERKVKEVPNGSRDLLVSYRAAVKLVQLAGKGPLSHPQKTALGRARALIKRVEGLPLPSVISVP